MGLVYQVTCDFVSVTGMGINLISCGENHNVDQLIYPWHLGTNSDGKVWHLMPVSDAIRMTLSLSMTNCFYRNTWSYGIVLILMFGFALYD